MTNVCRHCWTLPAGAARPDLRPDFRCSACGAVGTWDGVTKEPADQLATIRDIVARLLGSSEPYPPKLQLVERSILEELIKAAP